MLDIAGDLNASAGVHALAGSSRPGAVPPLVPLGAAAIALGAHPAAATHPDAEVIDFAGRVVRLVPRENRLVLRTCRIIGAYDKGAREEDAMDLATHQQRKRNQRCDRGRMTETSRVSTLRFGPKDEA